MTTCDTIQRRLAGDYRGAGGVLRPHRFSRGTVEGEKIIDEVDRYLAADQLPEEFRPAKSAGGGKEF